jgi:hypothetical protein
MQQESNEGKQQLRELNRRFLEEIEGGKRWEDVQHIMEEMKEVAKKMDHMSRNERFDINPHKNKK